MRILHLLPRRARTNKLLRGSSRQSGASLLVSLLMLVVILVLSISLTSMSLQGEKASRSDRDRQIAMQSAEAALKDAEMDIDPQTANAYTRSTNFDANSNLFFEDGCASGDSNLYQGLCLPSKLAKPVWMSVDISDPALAISVKFGRFTGQTMTVGVGSFPARLPRYIIEVVPDVDPGEKVSEKYMYRITAIGFGANATTQVVLQSFYRKAASRL